LRIRKEYNEDGQFLGAELSYKGSRRGELIEIRADTSIRFNYENEIDKLNSIFNRLGYYKLVRFIKKRERWKLENTEFEIDKEIIAEDNKHRIDLGGFCQATLETDKDVDVNKIVENLWSDLNKLGYYSKDFEKRSYIEIFFFLKNQKK